jgi:hypothetical protein
MSKDIVQRLIDLSMCADESSPADAAMLVQASEEIERLRLTDEERAAIGWAIVECESMPTTFSRRAADTLRALLERTG